jgi:hypothetical protein
MCKGPAIACPAPGLVVCKLQLIDRGVQAPTVTLKAPEAEFVQLKQGMVRKLQGFGRNGRRELRCGFRDQSRRGSSLHCC